MKKQREYCYRGSRENPEVSKVRKKEVSESLKKGVLVKTLAPNLSCLPAEKIFNSFFAS